MKKLILVLIICLAAVLRLWNLGNVPPSPDWDEAALGYNAYSIMQTGRDEYGKLFPVVLRSFDDYKPALYAYTVIPFIKLFGLTIQAVRLPSVIFGILAVLATYFLVKELFGERKISFHNISIRTDVLGLASSFLLAISPWHLQFSRVAFESNVGMSMNVFSILFFLKGLKKIRFMVLSFLIASVNIYMYQSEKVFTPLLFIILIVIYKKEFFKIPKQWLTLLFVLAVLVALPMMIYVATEKGALLRAQGTSVFSDQNQFLKRNSIKVEYDQKNNDLFGLILDNRRVEFAKAIVSGYTSHANPNWLFIGGDIARHHAPYMGLLYLFDLPFLLLGMYIVLFLKSDDSDRFKKGKLLLFLWFLIVPIPASITSGVPHAVRTLNFLPTFQIFIACGIILFIKTIFNVKIKYFLFSFCFLLSLFNFLYYLNQYFVQQNYFYSQEWQYGYQDAVPFVDSIKNNYEKIVVSNQAPLDQSYIFFLFYTQYDPKKYQESGGTSSGGFNEEHKGFENFVFRPIDWNSEKKLGSILFVGRPQDFGESAHILKTIKYIDGTQAIKIVQR